MNVHKNARLTPAGRALLVSRVSSGWTAKAAAEAAGVRFVAHNDHKTLYRDAAAAQLRLATGVDDLALPDWAIAILDEFDAALPGPVKRLLTLEATVVLTKG